jgi:two-component system, OmpR family, response regulator RegX3
VTKPTRVLVVEDEESFVDALKVGLGREGFVVDVARTGVEALQRFAEVTPDVILLDVMLPAMSGIDVCRQIRLSSSVPIIMVTAKAEEIDAVVGLEVGADDYVTKPYRLRELIARIRTVVRRHAKMAPDGNDESDDGVVVVGDLRIDRERHEVMVDGAVVVMPLKEFDLLTLLASNPGRVLTRDTLIDRVWGSDYVGDTKTLDVHIKRLRSKVEVAPKQPVRIVTVRGLGYKYAKAE